MHTRLTAGATKTGFNLDYSQILRDHVVRPLVEDRRPSQLYHSVILEGAREHGLPSHYMETLRSIEHNGDSRGDGSINITIGRF